VIDVNSAPLRPRYIHGTWWKDSDKNNMATAIPAWHASTAMAQARAVSASGARRVRTAMNGIFTEMYIMTAHRR
jgi:hypothetical protein